MRSSWIPARSHHPGVKGEARPIARHLGVKESITNTDGNSTNPCHSSRAYYRYQSLHLYYFYSVEEPQEINIIFVILQARKVTHRELNVRIQVKICMFPCGPCPRSSSNSVLIYVCTVVRTEQLSRNLGTTRAGPITGRPPCASGRRLPCISISSVPERKQGKF